LAFAATPTSTALSSSAGTAPVGQSITLAATVTGISPTGTVTFKDGGATIGSSAVTAGVASLSASALAQLLLQERWLVVQPKRLVDAENE
jgi:hypothetical protein